LSQYQSSITVACPPDQVFEFVSRPENMPQYLPTVHEARPQGEGRVEVDGNAAGHEYHSDGWFELDQQARTMKWGSDGENRYSGHLEVKDGGPQALVNITLNFDPRPDQEEAFRQQMGTRDATIRDGLSKALESIKNICEGHGGKVPSQADRINHQGYVS